MLTSYMYMYIKQQKLHAVARSVILTQSVCRPCVAHQPANNRLLPIRGDSFAQVVRLVMTRPLQQRLRMGLPSISRHVDTTAVPRNGKHARKRRFPTVVKLEKNMSTIACQSGVVLMNGWRAQIASSSNVCPGKPCTGPPSTHGCPRTAEVHFSRLLMDNRQS